MKKRILSLALAVVMLLSLLPVMTQAAEPTVSYVTDQIVYTEEGKVSSKYSNVVKNWGTRGELATFLSPMSEDFYGNLDYGTLSSYSEDQLQALMAGDYPIPKYDDAKYLLTYTDCQENGYYISDFYTGLDISPVWDHTVWNREHTWPQSKSAGGNDNSVEENDLVMIRATASGVNSSRNDSAYGESAGYVHPNKFSTGVDIRGDAARSVLYGYVRWDMQNIMWGTDCVIESKEILLSWMEADPVDTWEMGRNDSIQSITGTRNVFVDYPELAYIVLGEAVPTDMNTPSGAAKQVSYTVSAASNNEAWGTVYVNDDTVTAFPKSGYRIVGYTLLSGNANVTRSDDVFIVDGACTIRINFEAVGATALEYVENGVVVSSQAAEAGTVVFAPEHTGAVPEGCTFYGWVTETVAPTAQGPTKVYKPGDAYTVEQGLNSLYALYTYIEGTEGGEQWTLVTAASQLSVGTKVVIVAAESDVALSTNQKTNNRGETAIIKFSDNTIAWTGSDVQVLTLQEGTVSGTYGLYTGSGYLYANGNPPSSGSGNNYLKTGSLAAHGSWTITVSSAGVATLKSNGGNTNNWMRYNKTSSLFSCYGPNNQQKNISLYRAVGGGTTMYSTLNTPAPAADPIAIYAGNAEIATYATLEEAIAYYDPSGEYIKLLDDVAVDVVLDDTLYIDLNGKTLTGIMDPDGCMVYGMDSATDEYTCDAMGYFACVDAEGDPVVPAAMVKTSVTGAVKRYLTIETEDGYTFHRFYMGITHATLKPGTKGVGYKAVFAGDEMVKACVSSFGYTLQLGSNTPVTASKAGTELVSLDTVTLRVENYDAENMGQTELTASVYMVINGEKISGDTVTVTLKGLVEQINAKNNLTADQKEALAAWIAQSETMQSWNVGNIYTAE